MNGLWFSKISKTSAESQGASWPCVKIQYPSEHLQKVKKQRLQRTPTFPSQNNLPTGSLWLLTHIQLFILWIPNPPATASNLINFSLLGILWNLTDRGLSWLISSATKGVLKRLDFSVEASWKCLPATFRMKSSLPCSYSWCFNSLLSWSLVGSSKMKKGGVLAFLIGLFSRLVSGFPCFSCSLIIDCLLTMRVCCPKTLFCSSFSTKVEKMICQTRGNVPKPLPKKSGRHAILSRTGSSCRLVTGGLFSSSQSRKDQFSEADIFSSLTAFDYVENKQTNHRPTNQSTNKHTYISLSLAGWTFSPETRDAFSGTQIRALSSVRPKMRSKRRCRWPSNSCCFFFLELVF